MPVTIGGMDYRERDQLFVDDMTRHHESVATQLDTFIELEWRRGYIPICHQHVNMPP